MNNLLCTHTFIFIKIIPKFEHYKNQLKLTL